MSDSERYLHTRNLIRRHEQNAFKLDPKLEYLFWYDEHLDATPTRALRYLQYQIIYYKQCLNGEDEVTARLMRDKLMDEDPIFVDHPKYNIYLPRTHEKILLP